jgi:peptide/nickel transport system substrate-binding protein
MCKGNRTWIVTFLFVLLISSMVSACGSNEESEVPTASLGGEVQVEQLQLLTIPGDDWGYPSPFSFYPRGPGYIAMSLIFDTLTWKDEKGVIPWLADSWTTSEDGKTWTFVLHRGVKWHDGQDLTAEDVRFSFEYTKAHVAVSSWSLYAALQDVESVEVSGDHEVVIHLSRPLASFQEDVAGNMPTIPKHIWEDVQDPSKFTTEQAVVGSGPFKLADYNKEEGTYVYDANNDFFAGRPLVRRLVMTRVSDEALALETGSVDEASFWGKDIDVIRDLEKDQRFKVITGPSLWVLQLIFNCQKGPSSLAEFRKAVAHAIDREEIIDKVTHGGAIVANSGILHPESDWYSPDVATYDYDPAEAERLLDSLAFVDRDGDGVRETPEGEKLSFVLVTPSEYSREAEIIKENLAAVGIDVEVKALDYSTLDGILREGNFQLAINGIGGIAAPSILDQPDWPANTYKSEEYTALYQQQSGEMDTEKRRELITQLQAMVAGDLPVFGLYHPKMWCVFNPDKLNTWFYTKNGVAAGIPTEMNKLALIER